MNCISCQMVCKLLFRSEFPVILEKWWKKRRSEAITKLFAFQANARIISLDLSERGNTSLLTIEFSESTSKNN